MSCRYLVCGGCQNSNGVQSTAIWGDSINHLHYIYLHLCKLSLCFVVVSWCDSEIFITPPLLLNWWYAHLKFVSALIPPLPSPLAKCHSVLYFVWCLVKAAMLLFWWSKKCTCGLFTHCFFSLSLPLVHPPFTAAPPTVPKHRMTEDQKVCIQRTSAILLLLLLCWGWRTVSPYSTSRRRGITEGKQQSTTTR